MVWKLVVKGFYVVVYGSGARQKIQRGKKINSDNGEEEGRRKK